MSAVQVPSLEDGTPLIAGHADYAAQPERRRLCIFFLQESVAVLTPNNFCDISGKGGQKK